MNHGARAAGRRDDAVPRANARAGAAAPAGGFMDGTGEMARLMRAKDWSQTPLGPVEGWPQPLRTAVNICLNSLSPVVLWWGPELSVFYNDVYRPSLGASKHPALGKSGWVVWPEVWPTIGPMLEGVMANGASTWSEDQLLPLDRYGYLEEVYFSYSYTPIRLETGEVGGVFCIATETTAKVLAQRRMRAARDLAAAVVDARTVEEVCARSVRALATDPNDVPFALLYVLDREGVHARLAASIGLAGESPFAPLDVPLGAGASTSATMVDLPGGYRWPLANVARSGQRELIADLPYWPGTEAPSSSTYVLPPRAVLQPIVEPGRTVPSAILVAGVSPLREWDEDYESFVALLASHLSAALASAHAYEEERRRAEALAAIDRAKTAFFSNVSHEFRTPLTLMLGPLEDLLARQATLSPSDRADLELVHRNGLRLLKLVNTLLDFARIEAGRVQASYQPTDLAAYTADLASSFRSLVEKADLRLLVDCPPLDGELAAPVYVDREMWEKIVLNLLSNAFKFTLEGSITVTLRAAEDGRAVELALSDTGVGIAPEELPRLFERFHRVEGVRARTHEGSGIGLALVQDLVHLHGGTIGVESVEGVGTTFVVRLLTGTAHLPADRVEASSTLTSTAVGSALYVSEAERWLPGPSSSDRHMRGLSGTSALETMPLDYVPASQAPRTDKGAAARAARIVLADDNADMREYLARLLRAQYAVETVANGDQALSAIRREQPDLVLSDVMMPELDGFGLLRALRADPQTMNVPVILLSARAGEEATMEGLETGADDYLVKPFSAHEVLGRVAARLEIARTRAEDERRLHQSLTALMSMAEVLVEDVVTPIPGRDHAPAETRLGVPEAAAPLQQAEDFSADQDARGATRNIIRRLLGLTQQVMNGQYAGASYIDCQTGAFDVLATVGQTPEIEQRLRHDLAHRHMSDYYPPDVLDRLNAEEIVAIDFAAETPISGQDYYGLRNVLIVPARLDAYRLLVIAVEARDRPTFTPQERDLARAAVHLVRLALERERLAREREEGRLRELALEEATRRMDEFLGIASHELRTPLTSITANVQMASRQLNSVNGVTAHADAFAHAYDQRDGARSRLEQAKLLLERTNRQVVRMDRLVGDLLDVSRIQAGKLELRPESCDLLEIVRDVVLEQRAAWPKRTIALDLPRSAPVSLHADADRLGQVLTNYLTNALKYSGQDEPVVVRVHAHDNGVRVEVHDQGPGLTTAQQAHLFERFYRVPGIQQQSGSGVGLGLGLHICKTIVERHSGHVGVESAPDLGSTFWFELPLLVSGPDRN